MEERTKFHFKEALKIKQQIIDNFSDILNDSKRKHYLIILENINQETIRSISFRRPSWNATKRLQELTDLFKDLKEHIKIVQKRDYLSITPKIEDIKVVYKWIEMFNVPHYYFQVFFDKCYGISFKEILNLLTNENLEGTHYEISKDVKNQNKTTIKINTRKTHQISYKVIEPEHKSVRREMGRGRLLFHVSFDKGKAFLDIESLKELLSLKKF